LGLLKFWGCGFRKDILWGNAKMSTNGLQICGFSICYLANHRFPQVDRFAGEHEETCGSPKPCSCGPSNVKQNLQNLPEM